MNCVASGSLGFFLAIWRVVMMELSISARLYSYSTRSEGGSGACALIASFSFGKAFSYWLSSHATDMASGSEARGFLDGLDRGGAGIFDGPAATTSGAGSGDIWGLRALGLGAWWLGTTTSFGFTFSTNGAELSFL